MNKVISLKTRSEDLSQRIIGIMGSNSTNVAKGRQIMDSVCSSFSGSDQLVLSQLILSNTRSDYRESMIKALSEVMDKKAVENLYRSVLSDIVNNQYKSDDKDNDQLWYPTSAAMIALNALILLGDDSDAPLISGYLKMEQQSVDDLKRMMVDNINEKKGNWLGALKN